jgi:tetratricopeptide (TPR) repeat protein
LHNFIAIPKRIFCIITLANRRFRHSIISLQMRRLFLFFRLALTFLLTLSTACNVADRTKGAQRSELQDTLALLNQQITKAPNRAELYKERAAYFYRHLQWANAYQDIDRAIGLDSNNANYYFIKGFFLLSEQKDSAALPYFFKSIAKNKEIAEPYYQIGNIYFLQKDYFQALDWYQKAIGRNANEPSYLFAAALCHKQLNNREKAEYFALLSLKKDTAFIQSLSLLYDIHIEQKNEWEKAIAYNNKILQKDSTHPQAQFNLGFYWFKNSEILGGAEREIALKKAILYYSRAIFISPGFANAYYQRGYCYQLLSQSAKALEDYEKTIALNPNDYRAYYQAALIFKAYQEKEKAAQYLQRALSLQPGWQQAQKALYSLQ